MTPDDIAMICATLAPVMKRLVEKEIDARVAPLEARKKELELRVLELETRPEPEPLRGERGEMGLKGDPGPGLVSIHPNTDGRFIGFYSDGRTQDMGPAPKGLQGERGERGEPGKDAPPVDVDAVVTRVAALIPIPKDGRDGKDAPPVDVDAIVTTVLARLPAPIPGPKGDIGMPGKDAPAVDVDALVSRVAAMVPQPKDGAPGKDAEPVDVDAIMARVQSLIPVPKDGAPGTDGKDAPPVDLDALATHAAALIPRPKDGAPGPRGERGEQGGQGPTGAPGRDGAGIADLLLDHAGALVATFTDGRTKTVGIVLGKDGNPGAPGRDGRDIDMDQVKSLVLGELATWPRPKDGKDGRDGTWQGVKWHHESDRVKVLQFMDGTPVEGGVFTSATVLDRGVFAYGKRYDAGDGVTHDGHWWIAQEETTEAPGEGSKAWRLAVRRGKQGKEGKPGKDGKDFRPTNTPGLYGG